MQIFTADYTRILNEMDDLIKEGSIYLTYWNAGMPVRSCSDLSAFDSTYDAAEYYFEMSTDRDQMHYLPIAPLYKSMELAMQSANLPESGEETIDLAPLLRSYYRN